MRLTDDSAVNSYPATVLDNEEGERNDESRTNYHRRVPGMRPGA